MKRLLFAIVLLSGIWSVVRAATLGQTGATGNLGLARGYIYNREYTAPSGGNLTVSAFHFIFNGTTPTANDSFRVAVYAESGGLPGAMICQALGTGYTTAGTKDITMSGTISSGAKVVLAILLTSGSAAVSHNLGSVSSQVNGCYRGAGFATLPDPYGSCSSTWGLANEYSMWIDYTQSGGGSPAPSSLNVLLRKAQSYFGPVEWRIKPSDNWRWNG